MSGEDVVGRRVCNKIHASERLLAQTRDVVESYPAFQEGGDGDFICGIKCAGSVPTTPYSLVSKTQAGETVDIRFADESAQGRLPTALLRHADSVFRELGLVDMRGEVPLCLDAP